MPADCPKIDGVSYQERTFRQSKRCLVKTPVLANVIMLNHADCGETSVTVQRRPQYREQDKCLYFRKLICV
jgi:hypothetical protein